jgi:hypothetical protein
MIRSITRNGHSASVRIELRVNGHCLSVAQMGDGRLYFDHPVSVPATTGELIMHIDDNVRRWRVALKPTGEPQREIDAVFSDL